MNVFTFPPLYCVEKNGKTRVWKAVVYSCADPPYALIEHGQLGGKLQETVRQYETGKNIGKKNETSPAEQCMNETERKWKDKMEKEGYKKWDEKEEKKDENEVKKENIYLPMLAQTYVPGKSKKNDIVYPCYAQPKLDGLRCITYMTRNNDVVYQSRTGGVFTTMDHLTSYLCSLLEKGVILDGELYTKDIPFEELAGLIKKKKLTTEDKEKLKMVQYHVYDIFDSAGKVSYEDRYKMLKKLFNTERPERGGIFFVETVKVSSVENFKEFFSEFVQEGYEGIMLRNMSGVYRAGYRSNDLQKYKEFFEEEYPIIGFTEGEGRDKGAVIWICRTSSGKEFKVRPKGEMTARKEWFTKGSEMIGKSLTVIYQELSEYGVPRFPVGKSIRDGF